MSKMEVSTSEHESEYSNQESSSPMSCVQESPGSSPSQQVPQLISYTNGVLWVGQPNTKPGPNLHIVEQPMNYFRFRYKSEMVGTHGCILGQSTSSSQKTKTHPTVELRNYPGNAIIRVQLVQADNDDEHPHKLLEDEQDRDVTATVPERGSYKVAFAGLGIIHTAKKDVPAHLFEKYMSQISNPRHDEIRQYCDNKAKTINLNKVRLRFSAYDRKTNVQICEPVYSEPIHNMKSASTNDLKICRMSRSNGRAGGGDDIYLLVEKVNKKNIRVRFFQEGNDEEEWSAIGTFLQSDVHHQYAIVVRTPPYRDPCISHTVRVKIELVRPSDGKVSEPKEFMYKPDPSTTALHRQNKKRRADSTFSSHSSLSGGSLNSIGDLPVTVTNMTQNYDPDANMALYHNMEMPQVPTIQTQSPANDLGEALLYGAGSINPAKPALSPMLSQPNIAGPPIIQLNSSEFTRLLDNDPQITSEDKQKFSFQPDFLPEYMKIINDSLTDSLTDSLLNEKRSESNIGNIIMDTMDLVADSGRAKEIKEEPEDEDAGTSSSQPQPTEKNMNPTERLKGTEYTAHYRAEEGAEVKNLVKEICEIIKNKEGFKKQTVCSKLERLMEIRLSNGDTFLHMTLSSNQPSFEYIVKLIHSMRLHHLLTLTNDLLQTILHVAILHELPKAVSLLVQKGCDPMACDRDENTALHLAAMYQTCLPALLTAIDDQRLSVDINAYNNDKQTPLHLAAIYNSSESARLLLTRGADYRAADREGRTPLHLASYDDYLDVTRTLLEHMPQREIDTLDGRGNTALQIVCDSAMRPNTLAIARLLLEKKADPLKHEEHNDCAWQLARTHDALRDVVAPYVPAAARDEGLEVKSEPEDEYTSADEGECTPTPTTLPELPQYIGEVSAILDARGSWRALAKRLHIVGQPMSWFAGTKSPTRTLLNNIKESNEGMSSKSLAMHLQDMGEIEAANIIRTYV